MSENKGAKKAKKPRQKSITLKQLEKQYKDLDKYSTFVLDEETNTVIKYKEKFSESKINALLEEAYVNLKYVEENGLDFFATDEQFIQYVYFLIIKHFTELDAKISSEFEEQIHVMKQIVDTGLFRVLMENVFDGNEVMKVHDRLDKFVELASKIVDEENKLKQVKDNVANPEILKAFDKPNSSTEPAIDDEAKDVQ